MMERNPEMEKACGAIGLCVKSGQAAFGEDGCIGMIRSGQAGIVLVDEEASDNTKKRYQDSCRYYQTPLAQTPAGLIARAAGRSGRMAVAVRAGGLADRLKVLLAGEMVVTP